MQISNILVEESFHYTEDKINMACRGEEIDALDIIADYCVNVKEKVEYTDAIWEIPVEEGISLMQYLYEKRGVIREDDFRRLEEIFSKKFRCISLEDRDRRILVSLGEYENSSSNIQEYIGKRRSILSTVTDIQEYAEFMESCFPNSCFAEDIVDEMKFIDNFPQNVKEITDSLSVLDDEAIELYTKYRSNLKIAMDILSSKLVECAPDPKHAKDLLFTFAYEEIVDGKNEAKKKQVECSPHLKLIHPGSNLRIYFFWRDKNVGEGKKVLIGRIGRHPY